MFAFYPASAPRYQTPSAYERYQAAIAEAEAARADYLRDLSYHNYQPFVQQSHHQPGRQYFSGTYDYDLFYSEEQQRRKQFEQRAQRLQQERAERYRQEQLESFLGFVGQLQATRPRHYGEDCFAQRQPHVHRHQPFQIGYIEPPVQIRREVLNNIEQLLSLFLEGKSISQPAAALAPQFCQPQEEPVTNDATINLDEILKHVVGASQPSLNNIQPKSSSHQQASLSAAPKDVHKAAAPKPASASAPLNGFEQLLNHFFTAYSEKNKPEPVAMPIESSSSTPKESAEAAPTAAPASKSFLKAALDSRLANEHETEIRDTIQAIFESLQTPQPAPTPTSTAAPSKKQSADAKGKGKAVPAEEVPKEPTSLDVVRAMDTVTNIEASFRTLANDFDFKSLSGLSFTTPSPYIFFSGNDSDASTNSTSRLAYTSHNAPVRFYIHSLNGILAQLDAIESFGNEELRKARKEAVARVEAALEEVEHEVDMRFRSFETKRKSAEVVQVPIMETSTSPVELVKSAPEPISTGSNKEQKLEDFPAQAAATSIPNQVPTPDQLHETVESSDSAVSSLPDAPKPKQDPPEAVTDLSFQPTTSESIAGAEPEHTSALSDEAIVVDVLPAGTPSTLEASVELPTSPSELDPTPTVTVSDANSAMPETRQGDLSKSDTETADTSITEIDSLAQTIRPEIDSEPLVAPAVPAMRISSKAKSSEDDETVLINDAHSDWSEVDA